MGNWIVRMGESLLKSKPVRKHFTRVLKNTLISQCRIRGATVSVRIEGGLMFVEGENEESIEDALMHTFGIYAIDPSIDVIPEPGTIAEVAIKEVGELEDGTTFAVRCKRHGNNLNWTSQSFAGAVGAAVLERAPHLKVNLSKPDWEIRVALFPNRANLLGKRMMGPGGLPSGVQGLVRAQLESEMDILASWLIMHRGCRIDATIEDAGILSRWDPALASEEEASRLVTGPGREKGPQPWGLVGHNLQGTPTTVETDQSVRTPLANLEPLVGWSEEEIDELRHKVFA